MNASLQALAATPQLVEYFADDAQLLADINATSEFGMGGKVAARLAQLLRRMHGLPVETGGALADGGGAAAARDAATPRAATAPTQWKATIGRYAAARAPILWNKSQRARALSSPFSLNKGTTRASRASASRTRTSSSPRRSRASRRTRTACAAASRTSSSPTARATRTRPTTRGARTSRARTTS